jgi:FAD/FMN-containing dehydrogenase
MTDVSAFPKRARSDLQRHLEDRVVLPEHPSYDQVRRVWNARPEARPAVIVRCATTEDVSMAIRIARHYGLPVTVRGGGHSVTGHGTCDGGLVLQLAGLTRIEIDADRRVLRAGGGLSWGPTDAATARYGLATVGGQISTTGVGGLTVGGGVGWLMRRYGLTVDNLRSAELIDAEGQSRVASPRDDADLFWAVRGGGGNFGVVTTFELDLHPLSYVLAGTVLYGMDRAEALISLFTEVAVDAPNDLTMMILMLAAPHQPIIPAEYRGRPVALFAACYVGDLDEGTTALAPFRTVGPALADSIRVMPYVELQSMFDPGSLPGFFNTWRSPFIRGIDDDLITVITEYGQQMPTAISQVLLCNMGGAVAGVPEGATAFCQRDAPFYIEMIAKWEEGQDGDPAVAWADEFAEAVEPWSTGYTYVNFLDVGHPLGTRRAYDPPTYGRLVELKTRYDPDNVFRSNHNIPPVILEEPVLLSPTGT